MFETILLKPLFNILIFFYNVIPGQDFGIAIIVLTAVIRLALYPLSQKAIKSQKAVQELQPKIKEIQEKYKDNKETQTKEVMKFYKENKVNPFSGCLPLLVQIPILIGLWRILWKVFRGDLGTPPPEMLYSFIANPGTINPLSMGFLNLSSNSPILAVLTGFFQYIQSKMIMAKKNTQSKSDKLDFQNILGKQMLYAMPLVTIFVAWNFPAGLPLYWLSTTLFTIAQQWYVLRKKDNDQEKS